jgi:hypothetical protein
MLWIDIVGVNLNNGHVHAFSGNRQDKQINSQINTHKQENVALNLALID